MTGPRLQERIPTAWALWKMVRPSQVLLVAAVYALGVLIALGRGAALDTRAVGAGFVALIPVTAAIHYANEYADYHIDRVTERTPFSGGSGALHETGLPRRLAGVATAVSVAVAAIGMGGVLSLEALPRTALVLLGVGLVGGLQYSLPPLSLAWHGIGELDNALLGGLLLPCYGAATLDALDWGVVLAVLPFALLVFVNLLETQWPDRYADADHGRDTLAVQWSTRRLRAAYTLTAAAAFVLTFALGEGLPPEIGPSILPPLVVYATLPALPLFVWGSLRFTNREAPFPAVVGMVIVGVGQLLAWAVVTDLLAVPLS
ncbi:MAG: 1,4-dihydroxy-2-naphthoate octaprenyltransferase [Natronomonas sp.]|jgi:1,4-dihydroxy-2-naphthoate octaprenyltransferase